MQVENIECQIAQAQIGNFLSGSGLSDDAMQQLEEHISGCPSCKAALAEKRNELKAMLTQKQVAVDPSEIFRETEEQKAAKSIAAALRKKTLQQLAQPAIAEAVVAEVEDEIPNLPPEPIKAKKREAKPKVKAVVEQVTPAPAAPTQKPAQNWKPLIYSGALAAVLVAMSLFSNNLAGIFGPKLSEATDLNADKTNTTYKTYKPNTTTAPAATTPTTVAANTAPATVTEPVTEPTTTPAPPEQPSKIGDNAGAAAGALSTTQFETGTTTTPPVEPVKTETAKPTVAPAHKTVVKPRVATRKPVVKRRATAKRTVRRVKRAAPRKHGITVYQP